MSREGTESAAATTASRSSNLTATRSSKTVLGKMPDALSRVPAVRVIGIMWNRPSSHSLVPGFEWPEGLKQRAFDHSDGAFADILYPKSLKKLIFSYNFYAAVEGWSSCLRGFKCLTMDRSWNLLLAEGQMVWPDSLERLTFGDDSDQPLGSGGGGGGVALPPSLRELSTETSSTSRCSTWIGRQGLKS